MKITSFKGKRISGRLFRRITQLILLINFLFLSAIAHFTTIIFKCFTDVSIFWFSNVQIVTGKKCKNKKNGLYRVLDICFMILREDILMKTFFFFTLRSAR